MSFTQSCGSIHFTFPFCRINWFCLCLQDLINMHDSRCQLSTHKCFFSGNIIFVWLLICAWIMSSMDRVECIWWINNTPWLWHVMLTEKFTPRAPGQMHTFLRQVIEKIIFNYRWMFQEEVVQKLQTRLVLILFTTRLCIYRPQTDLIQGVTVDLC